MHRSEFTATQSSISPQIGCFCSSGLPYGWEEAYTADGVKYYINHMTQTTSWRLPETSGAVPEPPSPAEASELDAERDGEVSGWRPSPAIETEM
ncbi:syntaxin-binding protein 4-like [Odontesthes bonariensis]|uniref:syntaxin-binding protein 4-like n=1 Tax=Odontesthes bonariensis TaxID=219752 RepID=UPI003F58CBC1